MKLVCLPGAGAGEGAAAGARVRRSRGGSQKSRREVGGVGRRSYGVRVETEGVRR